MRTDQTIDAQLTSIEEKIRAGQISAARNALNSLNAKKIPRDRAETVASLAYRANIPNLSVRVLGSYIGDKAGLNSSLTETEIAEYAIALSRLGANKEARRWISSIQDNRSAKSLLYNAFISITEWNYQEAKIYLERHLAHPQITEYQALISQTNLAASLVFLQEWQNATAILQSLIEVNRKNNNDLLLANAYELMTQVLVFTENFKEAIAFADRGLALCQSEKSREAIYLNKWKCIANLYQKVDQKHLNLLKANRKISVEMGIWENIRECDFYLSEFQNDLELFAFVYFGTPHSSYRKHLLKRRSQSRPLPQAIQFNLRQPGAEAIEHDIFDLNDLRINDTGEPLFKMGSLFDKLLAALTDDFYCPQRLGTIFTKIYPNEFYDPYSSPDRVHQAIRRLRSEIKNKKIDISVAYESGGFVLKTGSHLTLKKSLAKDFPNNDQFMVYRLKETFGSQLFSLQEAKQELKISKTKTHMLLKEESEADNIIKIGQGPATKYKFTG